MRVNFHSPNSQSGDLWDWAWVAMETIKQQNKMEKNLDMDAVFRGKYKGCCTKHSILYIWAEDFPPVRLGAEDIPPMRMGAEDFPPLRQALFQGGLRGG